MGVRPMRLFGYICCVAVVAGLTPAFAQDATQAEVPVPPAQATISSGSEPLPSRVGRVSLVSGNVDLRTPGGTGWSDAEVNQPIFTGQALRTDPRSRGEIRIGANTIDLFNGTEIEITSLSDQFTQIAVSQGRVDLHLGQIGKDETVEIDFPRGGVWMLGPGRYDVDAGSGDQPARV